MFVANIATTRPSQDARVSAASRNQANWRREHLVRAARSLTIKTNPWELNGQQLAGKGALVFEGEAISRDRLS